MAVSGSPFPNPEEGGILSGIVDTASKAVTTLKDAAKSAGDKLGLH